ncbi:MAG: hypothetical protein WD200_04340 [Candidatus Andersenbacteria bacterium]
MEYEESNEGSSFFDRVKESPRTVSALIIILIVAAAIYAFSGDRQQPEDVLVDEEAAVQEQVAVIEEGAEGEEEGVVVTEGEQIQTDSTTRVSQEDLATQTEALPQAEKTDSGYKEVAAAGEGVTHLARKATTRHLSENNAGYEVTNEHRIYIEDYIQNRLSSTGLEVGQTMDVSFGLLQEAVSAAGQLNQGQLNNLSQYTGSLG